MASPEANPISPHAYAPPIHWVDRHLPLLLGIPAALAITVFGVGLGAFVTGSLPWGFSLCVPSGLGLLTMAVILFKARAAPRPEAPAAPYALIVTITIAIVTWVFIGWQTWLWFHPATPPSITQAQLDAYADKKAALATKPLRDQIEQLTKENESLQHGGTDVAKLIASLRAQIARLQFDKPISADKLPTLLQLHFANNSIEEIASKNVVWTKVFGWRERKASLTTQSYVGWTIIIVFKRPIAYKSVHFDDHGAGLGLVPSISPNHDPYFVVLELDSIFLDGLLLDITFDNKEPSK